MSDPNINSLWARAIVEELARGGVEHVVVCPGSRSSPLALACAGAQGLLVWSVVDERSAGFFALGAAKSSRRPVALVATSGTAGAHFYPAIIEAAMSHVPLVVLTADRPPELQGWGAPQTVPQGRMFGEFTRFFADLGVPEASDAAIVHLRATVAQAVSMAVRAPRGPVQLNVPLREPLAPTSQPFARERLSALAREGRRDVPMTRLLPPVRLPEPRTIAGLSRRLSQTAQGVIVCGPRDEDDGFAQAIASLSYATGYPVLAEASSQARHGGAEATISLYDALLRHPSFVAAHRPELVLRFGGGLTSKGLQQWIEGSGAELILFSDEGALFDPSHCARVVVEGSATAACAALARGMSRGGKRWALGFSEAERLARRTLELTFAAHPELSEPRVAYEVVAALPAGANLFVASSMPIRDVDAFAPAREVPLRVLANRGVNGIDGVVSSALGVAAVSAAPTVLLTGDLAFLHDIGGLLTAHRSRLRLTIVVVNNDGGGIFSFLPIAGATEHFEPLFATPHGVELAHAAELYGARFHRPQDPGALRAVIQTGLKGGLHVIEVRTERADNVEVHRQLFTRLVDALGEAPWR